LADAPDSRELPPIDGVRNSRCEYGIEILVSDAATFDQFDQSVALSGNTALVGARGDDDGGDDSGSAYLFEIPSSLSGDFNLDGDVDGADFLQWQRGGSFTPLSSADLTAWENNFGAVSNALESAFTIVPEPSSLLLTTLAGLFGLGTPGRRRRKG